MKNSVTAVNMKALAEKNLGELYHIIFRENRFEIFGERRRTNRECKETAKICSKNVISCFSSVLFLVLSETKRR